MKNLFKCFGIIALIAVTGFAFTACPTDPSSGDDSGKLTITGLEDYNGNYIFGFGGVYDEETEEGSTLYAAGGVNISEGTIIGTRISNGSAVLNVWGEVYGGGGVPELISYSGNDQNVEFDMEILSVSTWPSSESNVVAIAWLDSVNFSNGIATAVISNIIPFVKVNLGNGIEGYLGARHAMEGYYGHIEINFYDYTFATEGYVEDYEQDFELYVDGNLVPFSNNLSLYVGSSYIDFNYYDTDLLTAGESSNIRIKYTANPERPIKYWIPDRDADDWDVPPANAATLGSFDTGVKTVIVR